MRTVVRPQSLPRTGRTGVRDGSASIVPYRRYDERVLPGGGRFWLGYRAGRGDSFLKTWLVIVGFGAKPLTMSRFVTVIHTITYGAESAGLRHDFGPE